MDKGKTKYTKSFLDSIRELHKDVRCILPEPVQTKDNIIPFPSSSLERVLIRMKRIGNKPPVGYSESRSMRSTMSYDVDFYRELGIETKIMDEVQLNDSEKNDE